jgi:hypothetical protein
MGTKLSMYDSESRVYKFLDNLYDSKDCQNAVRRATTVEEICKISEEVEAPMDSRDLILFYRHLDHEFSPWHGMSKQKRREFIHEGRFKDGEE